VTAFDIRYPGRAARSRVRIARGGLAGLGRFAHAVTGARRAVVVSDANVARLWGAPSLDALRAAGIGCEQVVVPAGERSKRASRVASLWDAFAGHGLGRRDAVIALGGGVVGDLAGFAAATWLRGVPWIGVPTTLVAQVDSSVGGKTGIDLASGKNLVGAFHQPAGVLVDPDVLATLPRRHLRAGLAEVVKTGMAVDGALFRWLERRREALAAGEREALAGAVTRALRAKLRVVRADEHEREGGPRTALNFGHTAGHAIEAAGGYRGLLHGEAVAVGMRIAAGLSERVAGLAPAERARLESLLDDFGLPRRMPPLRLGRLLVALRFDKKRAHAGVRWVLTPRIGRASVPRLISSRLVRAALRLAGARA
jgi:3-dehydroquinate synthase